MIFEHRRLEVLANAVVDGPGRVVQRGLRVIVAPRVGFRKAEGFDAAQPAEEVGEAGAYAFHREVGDPVAPGTERLPRVGIGEVRLHALVLGAAKPAADVVPGEPA